LKLYFLIYVYNFDQYLVEMAFAKARWQWQTR